MLSTAGYLLLRTLQQSKVNKQTVNNIQLLPSVTVHGLDSVSFLSNAHAGIKGTVVFYFGSTCDHCQQEAEEVKKHAQQFKEVSLLWLSPEPLADLQLFEKKYALQKSVPMLRIAQVDLKIATKQLGFHTIPTILVYNTQGTLQKKFIGETKIEAILKYLK